MLKSIKPYIFLTSLVCVFSVMSTLQTAQAAEKKTVYVSSSGSADNSGESVGSPTTFATAYSDIDNIDTIIVIDDITYSEPPAHNGMVTIKGNADGINLTLSNAVNLQGDLTISNVNIIREKDNYHIYANGHSLIVDEDVTSSQRLIAFGGTNGKAYTGDTDITLLGGTYDWVCGGSSNANLIGNSNIVFGGNANIGDTIESKCCVYGGGNNSNVTGETNVTLSGNAVCQYVFGGSRITTTSVTGSPQKLNVNITGGNAMNVYGGTENYELNGCDVNVIMTGGTVEGVFGGSIGANLIGNVNVDLLGGEVTRRVYTGCYNEANIFMSYSTSHHVSGTTTLRIAPTMSTSKLISGSDTNKGVFAGSRYSSAFGDEVNTIIFLDGCYATHNSEITQSSYSFDSKEDYTVSATAGGDVRGTAADGTIYIVSELGKYATVNGSGEYEISTATLANTGTTVNTVEFVDYNFKIHNITASAATSGVTANVTLTANNNGGTVYSKPMAVIAVFDANGRFIASATNRSIIGSAETYTFDIPCDLKRENEYTVKAMLLNIDGSISALSDNVIETANVPEVTALKQIMQKITGKYTVVITADEIN